MLAAAVRDGDDVTKQHILQRVNPSLKVHMLDIERRIMLCEEAELDLLALRPEDRPELPYRPACFRMIDALSEEDARDLTRLSKAELLTHLCLRDLEFSVGRLGRTCRVTGEEMFTILSLHRVCYVYP